MKRVSNFFIFFILLGTMNNYAQSVAINNDGSTANTSAILDVKSTDKGVLVPRMTKAQRNSIVTPANGLLVYVNAPDTIGFSFYNGSQWLWLSNYYSQDTTAWKTTGNFITGNKFIGTTNDSALKFSVKNTPSGLIDSIYENTALGYAALRNPDFTSFAGAGRYNTAVGFKAMDSTGYSFDNVAVGHNTLTKGNAAIFSTAIGSKSLESINNSYSNTGVGYATMRLLTKGNDNVAVGSVSLGYVDSAAYNVAIGMSLLGDISQTDTVYKNIAIGYLSQWLAKKMDHNVSIGTFSMISARRASHNTAVGDSALSYGDLNLRNTVLGSKAAATLHNSRENVVLGYEAGNQTQNNLITMHNNVYVGTHSGYTTSTGAQYNTFVGDSSGIGIVSGRNNTFLGALSSTPVGNLNNATAIGYQASVDQNNSIVLGSISGVNGATNDTRVGIGNTAPLSTLHVTGDGTNSNPLAIVSEKQNDTARFMFTNTNSNITQYNWLLGGYTGSSDVNDKFSITHNGSPHIGNILTLKGDAKVGINQDNPSSTLQVDGTYAVGVTMGLAGGAAASPISLGNSKSYIGLSPVDGINNNYQLPAPATCPGRVYYIRNNSTTIGAFLTTAAGFLFNGNSPTSFSSYFLSSNANGKTIHCISDGVNWTIGQLN